MQSDDAIFDLVSDIIERQINPGVAQHGGRVELVDVQDATVHLRMMGGCQGCGMASVTLRQGIEASLKRSIPELRGIRDITDHTSGTNPYYKNNPSSTAGP
ncbi:MAG: NifU family protein [Gemmatimonadales bacterium]